MFHRKSMVDLQSLAEFSVGISNSGGLVSLRVFVFFFLCIRLHPNRTCKIVRHDCIQDTLDRRAGAWPSDC